MVEFSSSSSGRGFAESDIAASKRALLAAEEEEEEGEDEEGSLEREPRGRDVDEGWA